MKNHQKRQKNTKSFIVSLDELRTEAMRHGGLDAYHSNEKNAMAHPFIKGKLERLQGAKAKNAQVVMVSGYNEGYDKAVEYFESL